MCICTGLLPWHGRTATCSSSEKSNIVWLYSGLATTMKAGLPAAGHTSWSTTGMGYLSLWLAGKLQAFDPRGGQPWRLVVSLLPTSFAVYVGLTRIEVGARNMEHLKQGHLIRYNSRLCCPRQHCSMWLRSAACDFHAVDVLPCRGQ